MKKRAVGLSIVFSVILILVSYSVSFALMPKVDSKTYSVPSLYSGKDYILLNGVDVSYWQHTINWPDVKTFGMDYALVRIGYTGTETGTKNPDSYAVSNIKNAQKAGLMVGVYYYSQATTTAEARSEANYVIKLLKDNGITPDLPVIMDYEFASGRVDAAWAKWKKTSTATAKTNMTNNVLAFCSQIKAAGYEPMFYTYLNMLNNNFNMSQIDSKYKVWIAQYNTSTSYGRNFQIWQYTSSGKVNGINGSTDCNFWYYQSNQDVTDAGTASIRNADVKLGYTSTSYTGSVRQPSVTVTHNGTVLKAGTDYKVYYLRNVLPGYGYVRIEGRGSYSNAQMIPFAIRGKALTSSDITTSLSSTSYVYNGSAKSPTPTVKHGTKTLIRNTDYTVSYKNNVNAGTGSVTITGKDKYSGSVTMNFTISKATGTITTSASSYSKTILDSSFNINASANSKASLTYSSSDNSVASVSNTGTVTINGLGSAVITVNSPQTDNYKAASKTINLTVTKATPTITTDANSYSKLPGAQPFNLNSATTGDSPLTYSSSNPSVASVSKDGTVSVNALGSTTITVTSAETDTYKAASKKISVNVTKFPVTISTAAESYSIYYDSQPFNLGASSNSAAILQYSSSNDDVASVSSGGMVTMNGAGTAIITVTSPETATYQSAVKTITITSRKYTPTISVTDSFSKNVRSSSFNLKASTDSGAALKYSSSNTSIATVSSTGNVVMKGGTGTVYITVTSPATSRYNSLSRKVKITVSSYDSAVISAIQSSTIKLTSSKTTSSVKLTYSQPSKTSNVSYYQIYRSTSKNSGYKLWSTKTENTYWNTSSLKNSTTYYYKVRGVRVVSGRNYYTKWSNITSQKFVSASQQTINNIRASTIRVSSHTSPGYIKLHYSKSTGSSVSYYQIYRSTSKSSGYKLLYTRTGTTHTNTDSLKNGTTYYYKVRGVRVINGTKYYTKWSNITSEQYSSYSKQLTAKEKKIINNIHTSNITLTSTTSPGSISVKYSQPSNTSDVSWYQIYRSTSPNSGFKWCYSRTDNMHKDTASLSNGKTYYYKVRGVRVINGKTYYTPWSNIVSQKYTSSNQAAINNIRASEMRLSACAGSNYIKLYYSRSTGTSVSYYQIYRSTSKDGDYKLLYTRSGTIHTNTDSLIKGTTYYYKVRGVKVINGTKYYTKWSNIAYEKAR